MCIIDSTITPNFRKRVLEELKDALCLAVSLVTGPMLAALSLMEKPQAALQSEVGQNLQGRHSELRAEADFQINQKAEREIETVLEHLSSQSDLMLEILRHIERLEQGRAAGGAT